MEHDSRPVIEIYGSMECPYAYLATYRLRQVWPEFRSQVRLVWRALSLEYINRQSYPMPLHLAEHSSRSSRTSPGSAGRGQNGSGRPHTGRASKPLPALKRREMRRPWR